jgi:redox-sensitive bicupin YhaK (pirin superfamily)
MTLIIPSRRTDLGGFIVGRILPYTERRMVGPFIFLDHMGPATFETGKGIDVRPHPHIGLSTITYLFSGEILHRDSLGTEQAIRPGDVNWMTAGSGITHSERTGADERSHPHDLHGLQSWIALPLEAEECAPEFFHHKASTLPEISENGVTLRVIAGSAYGKTSPVKIYSPLFYVEAKLAKGAAIQLPDEYSERAFYIIDGDVTANGENIAEKTMAVYDKGSVTITANENSHLILLGGEPFAEPRFMFWNFVSSSKERLEQAKADWKAGKFAKVPGDEVEFIPLP